MATPFTTPGVGGFNRRGAHPDGGHYYGGCETALCELVRGGDMVIREIVYHDDDSAKVERAPILLLQHRARNVREKIGVSGRYLLNGAMPPPSLAHDP